MAVAEAPPPLSVVIPELKKYLNSKVPRGVRRYLRVVAREMVDSCRPSFLGDLAQGQRAHRLRAVLQEAALLPDDGAGDPQQGVGTGFQALDQPARFLQLRAQVAVVLAGGVADQALVVAVDADARLAALAGRHFPDAALAVGDGIGNDEFGFVGRRSAPRAWDPASASRVTAMSTACTGSCNWDASLAAPCRARASRCRAAIRRASARPGVAGSSSPSCTPRHSDRLRAPTPTGSKCWMQVQHGLDVLDGDDQLRLQGRLDVFERRRAGSRPRRSPRSVPRRSACRGGSGGSGAVAKSDARAGPAAPRWPSSRSSPSDAAALPEARSSSQRKSGRVVECRCRTPPTSARRPVAIGARSPRSSASNGGASGSSSSRSSRGLLSTAWLISTSSSAADSCSRRIAWRNCGVSVSCCPIRSCRVGFMIVARARNPERRCVYRRKDSPR